MHYHSMDISPYSAVCRYLIEKFSFFLSCSYSLHSRASFVGSSAGTQWLRAMPSLKRGKNVEGARAPLGNHTETGVLVGPREASNFLQRVPETASRDFIDPTHMLEIREMILCCHEPNRSHGVVANSGPGATVSQVSRHWLSTNRAQHQHVLSA